MWTCPDCMRVFRKKTWHSCAHYELADHLAKMNLVQEDIFVALRSRLHDLADVAYDAVKSCIELRVNGSLFALIKPVKGILRISFIHEKPIRSPRIHKTHQYSKQRCYNIVDLADIHAVDQQLIEWLTHAYLLYTDIKDTDRS